MPLPTPLYTAAQVRALDAYAIDTLGVAGYTLMKRAGEAALRYLRTRWPTAHRIVIVCGGGNNGGGAAAAQGNSPFVPDEIVTSFRAGGRFDRDGAGGSGGRAFARGCSSGLRGLQGERRTDRILRCVFAGQW